MIFEMMTESAQVLRLLGPICLTNPSTQDINLTYIRRSGDVKDVFQTLYIRSIYVLCPGGKVDNVIVTAQS